MFAIVVFVAYSTARQSRDAQDQAMRATRHALETKAEEVARTAQTTLRGTMPSAISISSST